MKIVFLSVGAVKRRYIREGLSDYTARIRRYLPFDDIEVREGPYSAKGPAGPALLRESERIFKRLKEDDYVVVLSEGGEALDSAAFARTMERVFSRGRGRMVFVTGGPFGLHQKVLERADLVLSLSAMTFPHELARLVLAEQVYRALTIIRGEPYSH